jgi:hypothetical protein
VISWAVTSLGEPITVGSLEAHRSGLSVHRIAQIFRERGVDISVPHLVRTVRRFVDEEERVAG